MSTSSLERFVYPTAVASLTVQVLSAIATSVGVFIELSAAHENELRIVLLLEFVSQIVEMTWYVVILCYYKKITTWYRYVDWVVSTPVMIVSTAIFFHHRANVLECCEPISTMNWGFVAGSLAFNWLMLASGYALETGRISNPVGIVLGSAALVGSFTFLATFVPQNDMVAVVIFTCMYTVWAFYGVAAALPDAPKNIMYNGLDIVSKNFYGVFLLVYVLVL